MTEEEKDYQESENTGEEQGNSEEENSEQQSSEESAEDSKDYSELYANQKTRAEKAEAKLKELKAQLSDDSKSDDTQSSEEQTSNQQVTNQVPSAEELRLIAQKGYSDEELDKLRKVAQVEDVSLNEAAESDIFTTWKQGKDKQDQGQMSGSKGSGRRTQEKSVGDTNLSAEEHKRLWKQAQGL